MLYPSMKILIGLSLVLRSCYVTTMLKLIYSKHEAISWQINIKRNCKNIKDLNNHKGSDRKMTSLVLSMTFIVLEAWRERSASKGPAAGTT